MEACGIFFVDRDVENMPKIVDVDAKRREILNAAIKTFAKHGMRGTNLARVAKTAGMGKSSLYHYFETREELFSALADDILRHEAELFRSLAAQDGAPRHRLRALVDGITALFSDWASAGPLLIDFLGEPKGKKRLEKTLDTARNAIADILREGQRSGDFRSAGSPDAIATILLGTIDGLFLQELIAPGSTAAAARGSLLHEILENGVLAKPEDNR